MGIAILILKIIGIVLAVLLGLVLLAFLCVLLVPIRYKVAGRYPDEPFFEAKLSWLLHLISLRIVYEGQDFNFRVAICGFRISSRDEKKPRKNRSSKTAKKNQKREAAHTEQAAKPVKEVKEASKPESLEEEEKDFFDRIEEDLSQKKERLDGFGARIKHFKEMLEDEHNQDAFSHLMEEVKKLLPKIGPKRMKGSVDFSLGSPDTTGYALGLISMMPFVYDKAFHLYADFTSDDPYFKGNAKTGGTFRILPVALSAWSLWRDPNIRRFLHREMQ